MLETILAHKQAEVETAKIRAPLAALVKQAEGLDRPRSLFQAITGEPGPAHRIIAEIKKASPSRGVLRADFEPGELAACYERAGAVALSVLTDERFFQGSLAHLAEARGRTRLPVLRKDFVLDPYQVYEARVHGADAVLLIVRVLSPGRLAELLHAARGLGMEALVEVHSEPELDVALNQGACLVGVNNRDLETFVVDLQVTERLVPRIPSGVLAVSASGIRTREELHALERLGIRAFLIGEALVTSADPERKLRELAT